MKITLKNYPTAAAAADTSRLDKHLLVLHEQLLEFGEELLDGADDTTRGQYAELLDLLNEENGGSQASNPAAEVKKPKAPRTPKAAAKAPRTSIKKTAPVTKAAVTTKPAAKPRTTKAKPEPAGGNVRGISPSVALIRGFVQLLGKEVPGSRVDAKLRAVQAAMSDGRVTAKSPHGKEVEEVQDLLLKAMKQMGTSAKPEALVTLNVSNDDVKAKLVGIAGGEKVFESVAVLRAYVKLSGKKVTKEQIANLLKRVDSQKIKAGDPFQEELKDLVAMLKKAKPGQELAPTQVGLSGTQRNRLAGLAGLVRAVDRHATVAQRASLVRRATTASKKKSPAPWREPETASRATSEKGAGTIKRLAASQPRPVAAPARPASNGIVSSASLMRTQYETYMVVGEWAALLHEPQKNFAAMVWGLPGQGKSTLLTKLARYLARTFGPCLYVQNEEFGSHTVQKRLSAAGGSVPGLDFSKHVPDDAALRNYKFLILDSVSTLKISVEQYRALKLRHPQLATIVVLQATKGGQFKGNNEWPHEVDIEIEAFGPGKARTTKNRFGPLRTITIF